jgi:hypothetical protein
MKEYEKIYHIYAKNRCVYHNLSEEKFSETWDMLHRMIDILDVDISKEDLQYEMMYVNKLIPLNSSY